MLEPTRKKKSKKSWKKLCKIAMVASMTMTVVGGIIIYYHEPSRQMLIALGSKIKPKFFKSLGKNPNSTEEIETSNKLNSDTSKRWGPVQPEFIIMVIILVLVKLNNQGEISVDTNLDRELTFEPSFWKGCWEFFRNYQPVFAALTTLLACATTTPYPLVGGILHVAGWQMVSHSRS